MLVILFSNLKNNFLHLDSDDEDSFSLHDISEVREGFETDIFNKIENDPTILAR